MTRTFDEITEMPERWALALALRGEGLSFKDIGVRLGGVSAPRARQIVSKAARRARLVQSRGPASRVSARRVGSLTTIAGLVAAALFAGATSAFASSAPSPPQYHPSGGPEPTVVVRVVPAARTPAELRAERADVARQDANERHMVLLTGALALIGGLQLFVFGYQAQKLRQTVRDGERAVAAATASADAAKRQSEITIDTAKRQLRAYVGLATAQVHYVSGQPSACYIEVQMKNYGVTPAYNVISRWGEHVREWPLQSILPNIPDIPHSIAPLPPGRVSIQRVPISPLSPWEEGEVAAGRAGFYFWSEVSYADIYGEIHHTRVRLVCEGDGLEGGHMHPFGDEEDNQST